MSTSPASAKARALAALARFEQSLRENPRYPRDAYDFLRRGVLRAAETVHGATERGPRHVNGRQLCESLRDLALEEWGPLAGVVLKRWNIRATRNFGEMVFHLAEIGLLAVCETDHISDFENVYDFRDAFDQYEIRLPPQGPLPS